MNSVSGVKSESFNARACVYAALIITFLVMLPLLAAPTLFSSDDWAYFWINRIDGIGGVYKFLSQVGHPGYGPFLGFLWWSGGEFPARWAHVVEIFFQLSNGYLIWRIFQRDVSYQKFAAILATLYLISPFIAGSNFGVSSTLFDMLVFFTLLSIRLSASANGYVFLCALILALFGLTMETLMAFEPIRWWFLYKKRPDIKRVIGRAMPFALAVVLAIVTRLIWFQPEGPYFGYNSLRSVDIAEQFSNAAEHISFFFGAVDSIQFAKALVYTDSIFLSLLLAVSAIVIGILVSRSGRNPSCRQLALLALVGCAVLVAGGLPYNLIGSIPQRVDNLARFAVVSQFGALILLAAMICSVPSGRLQGVALAIMVFVFLSVPLQMTKWLLYEDLVLKDFRRQVSEYLASAGPQILAVQFDPQSRQFLFRHRGCLSSYDINGALEFEGTRNGSYVFDRLCGPDFYTSRTCGFFFKGFPMKACPSVRKYVEFRLNLDANSYTKFRLFDLAYRVIFDEGLDAGKLSIGDPIEVKAKNGLPADAK